MSVLENIAAEINTRAEGWITRITILINNECSTKYDMTFEITPMRDYIGFRYSKFKKTGDIDVESDVCYLVFNVHCRDEEVMKNCTQFLDAVASIYKTPCNFVPPSKIPNDEIIDFGTTAQDMRDRISKYVTVQSAGKYDNKKYRFMFGWILPQGISFICHKDNNIYECFRMHLHDCSPENATHFAKTILAYINSISEPDNDVKPLY